ncbi:MAG TPA: hypothetical protein VK776_27735 [Bryobacteraceae bacterium]|nr:hypothetical protein [Bryobacteraceae bacterium]
MKLAPFLLFPCVLFAQNRPQFVWQGQVEGIVILHLRDKRLDVQVQEGSPVERQQFQFHDRLPDSRQDARLEILEGRGYAHIVDQPRLDNHYTLAVGIEDRQPGSSFYSIALYWDASTAVLEHPDRSDKLAWSGRVDQETVISCRVKSCIAESAHGAPVADEHFKFSRPLPNREVTVSLEQAEGRGEIRLVEQPNERNQYTARVSIRDPQSGSGEYSFALAWPRDGGKEPELRPLSRRLVWNGTVDGRVRVIVQGGAVLSEAVAGQPVTGQRAEVLEPLPARADLNPVVKKLRGRGEVQIVEQPSDKNNYRLVFEIRNPEGGADNYEIEVDW